MSGKVALFPTVGLEGRKVTRVFTYPFPCGFGVVQQPSFFAEDIELIGFDITYLLDEADTEAVILIDEFGADFETFLYMVTPDHPPPAGESGIDGRNADQQDGCRGNSQGGVEANPSNTDIIDVIHQTTRPAVDSIFDRYIEWMSDIFSHFGK